MRDFYDDYGVILARIRRAIVAYRTIYAYALMQIYDNGGLEMFLLR